MAIGGIKFGQELLNVPMGEMVRSVAVGIAEAQWQLDKSSINVAELMSGQRMLRDLDTGKLLDHNAEAIDGSVTEPIVVDSRVYFGYEYLTTDEAGADLGLDGNGKQIVRRVPQKVSMMELGFAPNFYQFVDTIIEVKIAIKISRSREITSNFDLNVNTSNTENSRSEYYTKNNDNWWSSENYGESQNGGESSSKSRSVASATSVDASYANKFGYSAEGSSLMRTKMVPIPAPPVFEDRIRQLMDNEDEHRSNQVLAANAAP